MFVTVDRVEDGIAVLELPGRVMMEIPKRGLPEGCKAGETLRLDENGRFVRDEAETEKRRRANIDLFNSLLAE